VTFFIILGLSAFLISLLGTRLTILALRKRAVLLDYPNFRSNHQTPTLCGGGIAVVMALVICLLVADINYGIILAVFMLAAVSLMDDLVGVPLVVRLLVQALAVAIPLSLMHAPVFGGWLPGWLDKGLTAIMWLWFINLFNFMDGIDGISSIETICIGVGLCLIIAITGAFPNHLFTYSLIVASAACGFLWWNRHPAKIFLGDVGSIPLGFLLGYLLLMAATSGYLFPALILPAYYLSDSTITLLKRAWQRKKIWQGHSEHYYQQAVRAGWSHDAVAWHILGINGGLITLAVLSVLDRNLAVVHLALAYMAVFMLLDFLAHTRPYAK
jgi:UDP-N-acetylmuramyl pentapeptide phosphotransferase/UDP-N-acetylglucosamine-1-phosphate transferase